MGYDNKFAADMGGARDKHIKSDDRRLAVAHADGPVRLCRMTAQLPADKTATETPANA